MLGDGGAANDPHDNGRTSACFSARCCGSTSIARRPACKYAIPKDNPFVGTERRPAGDLVLRPAQPVADRLRPRDRRAAGAATSARTSGRRSTSSRAAATTAGTAARACTPSAPRGPARARTSSSRSGNITTTSASRSPAAPSIAASACRSWTGTISTPTTSPTRSGRCKYDESQEARRRQPADRRPNVPIMSFGEDEQGEVYFMTYTPTGQGIHRFTSADAKRTNSAGSGIRQNSACVEVGGDGWVELVEGAPVRPSRTPSFFHCPCSAGLLAVPGTFVAAPHTTRPTRAARRPEPAQSSPGVYPPRRVVGGGSDACSPVDVLPKYFRTVQRLTPRLTTDHCSSIAPSRVS